MMLLQILIKLVMIGGQEQLENQVECVNKFLIKVPSNYVEMI